jgi:hypothetical protein
MFGTTACNIKHFTLACLCRCCFLVFCTVLFTSRYRFWNQTKPRLCSIPTGEIVSRPSVRDSAGVESCFRILYRVCRTVWNKLPLVEASWLKKQYIVRCGTLQTQFHMFLIPLIRHCNPFLSSEDSRVCIGARGNLVRDRTSPSRLQWPVQRAAIYREGNVL